MHSFRLTLSETFQIDDAVVRVSGRVYDNKTTPSALYYCSRNNQSCASSFTYYCMIMIRTIALLSLWVVLSEAFTPPRFSQAKKESLTSLFMAGDGLTLYGHPGTRSPLINWACLELQLDFTMGDLSANPHPFGQLPCLTDDAGSVVVFESGAILQYIHQYYNLQVPKSKGAAITSWITWANASLDPICFLETNGKVYDTGLRKPNRRMDRLNDILAKQPWLVDDDDSFSLADVAVASYLSYVLQFFPDVTLHDKWPAVAKYLQASVQRPAYGQAFGAATQARLLAQLEKDIAGSPSKLFGMF